MRSWIEPSLARAFDGFIPQMRGLKFLRIKILIKINGMNKLDLFQFINGVKNG